MIKLVNAKQDIRLSSETIRKPSTLKSPKEVGYDYAIVNEFKTEEPVRFTEEQIVGLFKTIQLPELIALVPAEVLAIAHNYRVANDSEYKELVKPKKAGK